MPARSIALAERRRGGTSPLVLAIGFAVVAFALGAGLLSVQRTVQPEPPILAPVVAEYDTVTVPVPMQPVPAGAKLKDVAFKQQRFPKHQLPPGSITEIGRYADSVAIAPLPANLPLFAQNLSFDAAGSNPVLERIPAGMRAMTVRVDATAAVEGWAGSGSIVDVLLIEKDRTTVVAERVKILSAERSVVPVEGQAAPNVPSTVTLLVTQGQCLSINTAIPRGRIAFALRGTKDEQNWSDLVFTASQLQQSLPDGERAEQGAITGFVSFSEAGKKRAFALSKGRWVSTEVVPQGTLIGDRGTDSASAESPAQLH